MVAVERGDVEVGRGDVVVRLNFRRGIQCRMTPSGQLVPLTRWERAVDRVRASWHRMTRWWRPRTVVSAVDAENGVITLIQERWSWRRWRWEER